ncbi:hypothetical protein [Bordetella petrii]|uniref:Uncharacterized protein n=1 Tax=Bordetella petrii (strain ATCC BAA-461 / DSM 12804 / CCUG 43448 / CIP 107267 / Se-1111R) TaxID=340100 RepID=A9I8T7_BORPD|nr:hypothetical protein [Bordetella petrii]CAP41287.1 hypothetical protein predicted by Glimmer/Critica [Bordetella petrii]
MSDFAKSPAFPQSALYDASRDRVHGAYEYGAEMGLNMQQHVWLTLMVGALGDGSVSAAAARAFADEHLDITLERLEKLA